MYKTIILPVLLYRRNTWSLTLRKDIDWRRLEQGVVKNIWT